MKLSFIALFSCISPILLRTSAAEEEGSLKEDPHNLRARVLEPSQISVVDITPLVGDVQKYKDEDEENRKSHPTGGIPLRVAARVNTNIKKTTHGITEILEDGTERWQVCVKSNNALFLSFDFANIKLDDNQELLFYAADQNCNPVGDVTAGPFNKKNNNDDLLFGSPTIPSGNVVIELRNKGGSKGDNGNPFVINKVMHGYRNFQDDDHSTRNHNYFDREHGQRGLQSVPHCSPDIACEEGNSWRDDAQSVAKIYFKGYICTGQMIATTDPNDCTPYFLTARHCISKDNTASVTTFSWNYAKPSCNAGSASESQQSYGAKLVSSYKASDFSLLELNQVPDPAYNVYYAGWDASTTAALSTVCIHHPSGLPKKISFENNAVVSVNGGYGTDHWRVSGWDIGTTLGGSSGSGLWNEETHRIVGQLHGGTADCDGGWDEYGKFDVSWENGLSSILDPSNTGSEFADGHGACGVVPECMEDGDCDLVECQTATCNAGNCVYSDLEDTLCSGGVCCGGSCRAPACSGPVDCSGSTCSALDSCAAQCQPPTTQPPNQCGTKGDACGSGYAPCCGRCHRGNCK